LGKNHRMKLIFKEKYSARKYNCAQKILTVFADQFKIDKSLIDDFRHHGFGRSPGGECGAIFAAKYLLRKQPLVAKEIENKFLHAVGETQCKAIRRQRKISCKECIQIIIDLMQEAVKGS